MASSHDTPLKRFGAFWIGLLMLAIFAVISLVFALFSKSGTNDMEAVAAEGRQEIHKRVNKEQAVALNPEAVEKALESELASLITSKPSPGSMPVVVAAPAAEATPAEPNPAQEGETKEAAPEKDADEPAENTSTES